MRTTVYVGISLDGYLARENGDIGWLSEFESKEVFRNFGEFIATVDAFVIGRNTYEKVLTFPSWPYGKMVFVLSTSLKELPAGLRDKAEVVSMKPRELLSFLARKGYSNLYVDGGKVIQEFLREDCVDHMVITRIPILIGSGIPLFGSLEQDLRFEHERTDILSNGLVTSRYTRKRG